ncbi:MAG: hypothetical protein KGO93_06580 [Cyanobacteria bacterium REEB446]|nr:hypothetical protein [Cyanobacteria bacterium REEB446]
MFGANKNINDLLDNLFDFSIKTFQVENISNLDSIDELLQSILDFIEYSLKHIEKVYLQLREWYATHTPEAPHIMHIPLHPAAALVIHNEALRKLGTDFESFDDYDDFLKKVRTRLDVCSSSKHLLQEQKSFLENSDVSYIYYQLPNSEKPILVKSLMDLRPAIENILLNFQNSKEHMPGNLYIEGGFIGAAFSETNNSALELYRVKKIITLIKEGMNIEHINLYQKVFESQIRLNKMLTKAIQEFGVNSFQAQLYSAQAEASRLAKKYIEEIHQVTQSKLILDIEQANIWFKNGKPSLHHPLHRENPENFLTEIRIDFLETKSIEKITALYSDKNAKYTKALRKVSNKQKLIEKFINFDRNSTIDESELIRILVLLHKSSGSLSKNIDISTVKEALQNIGISSSYLEELEKLTLQVTKMDMQISFDKVSSSFLNLEADIEAVKLKQYIAVYLNSIDKPLSLNEQVNAPRQNHELILKQNFLENIFKTQGCEKLMVTAFKEYFDQKTNQDPESINHLIEFFIQHEKNFGISTALVKLREIVVKIYFLTHRLNSQSLYQKVTKEKFFHHDKFFKLASKPLQQIEAFQKYQYLTWAQKLTEGFTKADDSLLELLIANKLNFKTALLSLTYLSKLNSSRYQLIQALSSFNNSEEEGHLQAIEKSFFENFKNESNIFAILARGGSFQDIQAMDNLGSLIETLYLNISNCKRQESLSTENSGAHRLSRQQYYSMWGARSGLYHNLNKLKDKDVHFLKEQSQRLLQIGDQLQKVVQETNHDKWTGYIFENLDYQILEQKWFQKISLINDFLRGSSELKEALDLFGVCDKGYKFDKLKAERLLSDFKTAFIKTFDSNHESKSISIFDLNGDQKLDSKDFKELYRVICFRFDELKQNRDPFFKILIFNLIILNKANYYESLKTKFSRYSEQERFVFSETENLLYVVSSKLDTLAFKVAEASIKLDINDYLSKLNEKIQILEENLKHHKTYQNEIFEFLNDSCIYALKVI